MALAPTALPKPAATPNPPHPLIAALIARLAAQPQPGAQAPITRPTGIDFFGPHPPVDSSGPHGFRGGGGPPLPVPPPAVPPPTSPPPTGGPPHGWRGGGGGGVPVPAPPASPPPVTQPPAGAHPPAPKPAAKPPSGGAANLDSTYFGNVAANTFKVNNAINALNLQGSQAGTTLQAALAQLAYAQPRAELGLEQKANTQGALYSSVFDQNLGNLDHTFLGQRTGAQTKYAETMSQLAAKIAGLRGSIPLYDAQQADASTIRESNRAAHNPALGAKPPAPKGRHAPKLRNARFPKGEDEPRRLEGRHEREDEPRRLEGRREDDAQHRTRSVAKRVAAKGNRRSASSKLVRKIASGSPALRVNPTFKGYGISRPLQHWRAA